MSAREELLSLMSALQNEIAMSSVDPDMAEFSDDPKIIESITKVVAAIEHIFPMIQAVEEVLEGAISTKLFHVKWRKAAAHMGVEDDIGEADIGDDVKGLLGKFGNRPAEDIDEEDGDED